MQPVVIAFENSKGGVGKTTQALCVATAFALIRKKRVLFLDCDTQESALDHSARRGTPSPFSIVGHAKPTIHREIASLSRGYDITIIDGAPRGGAPKESDLARSAIAAADMVVIPVQPSPFDIWSAHGIIAIIEECRIHKPQLQTHFLINRLFPNTTLGAEITEALGEFNVPVLSTAIRNRTEYAKAARSGLTPLETEPNGPAAQEIMALTSEIEQLFKHANQQEKVHAVR